jgi:hypothetical protein
VNERKELAQQLAQNIADIADGWTKLRGHNVSAAEIMGELGIDRDAFGRDLGAASIVDYIESLRGLEIEIPPTFEEIARTNALLDEIRKIGEEARRGNP